MSATAKRAAPGKRKPTPSKPSKRGAVADMRRIAKAAQVAREMRDAEPASELSGIRRKLKLVQSCSWVVGAALRDQNNGLDSDAADILGTHVTDVLHIQLMKIDRLLGHEVEADDIAEDDDGGAS